MNDTQNYRPDLDALAVSVKRWAAELGFQQCGVSDTRLDQAEAHLFDWLEQNFHGEMEWMARHGTKRSRPAELVPGTIRVISVRMDYLPAGAAAAADILQQPETACLSRYALGRDYHKVLRRRLHNLVRKLAGQADEFNFRAFTDSAPVLEKALAQKAGLGWIGKHTNLLNRRAGSWFFIGEIYTDLPLPVDAPAGAHCGACDACIQACPTRAIVAPYQVDARRCISYLTIEHKGAIPVEFRPLLGNRIYGCDDCQLFCPWNRFARSSGEPDFAPRHGLDQSSLVRLFQWSESQFLDKTAGSPIRRIGYVRWLRNIAVALGNAPASERIVRALQSRRDHPAELVREHVAWALMQHAPK